MKKILKVLIDVTMDAINNVTYFIKDNLLTFATILNVMIPYIMYFVGQDVAINRGRILVGGELFLPIIFTVIIYYLKSSANKIGKGISVPIPDKRFTEVSDDGEVNIENKRIQELILYIADLEDWMERKGLL